MYEFIQILEKKVRKYIIQLICKKEEIKKFYSYC